MTVSGRRERAATTALVLAFVWAFLLVYFEPSLLLLDTMDAGGDTPSFIRPIHHLRDVLLPAGNPQGWDLANFAGYAPYQFYFLPPSLAIVALSTVIPLNVAFKLVTVAGTFLLPLTTALALRALGYAFPVPALAAAGTLVFLFNEGNSMWGGNILSTLAGEFAYSLGFALAILAVGMLYRGVERQRGWRSVGAVLALTGLCHPVAFLNATLPGLFFVLERRSFVRNLRFLVLAYGTAVLLMAFWLVPLIAKLGFATSINWKWHFNSWSEVLPRTLQPVAALAALDVLCLAVRRRAEDRPARYLLFAGAISVVCFANSTRVGLPEIRFVPFVYLILILLALDCVRRLLPLEAERWPGSLRLAPHVGALAVAFVCAGWAQASTSSIPHWIRWNYEGLERKPSYPLLRAMADRVAGAIGDPRIAYENSPAHDRFGSMRVFEDMALLTGRATLEGVLLQTAVTSPYIYWLQSQISKLGTGVIPGYSYPHFDPGRATLRLALFNAHDLIAVTPELKTAMDGDPRWERIFHEDAYAIYRLRDADRHYVRVPRFQPVLLEAEPWKRAFHRWFASDAALDVPLVAARSVAPAQRGRFAARSDSPTDFPRLPIEASCDVEERIDHLAVEFTTTCPGLPHWIAVSYFPNWMAEGASGVFLASPGFMLVFPDGPRVRLEFRRVASDWLGLALSALGLGVCLVRLPAEKRATVEGEPGGLGQWLGRLHPWLRGVGLTGLVAVTSWNLGSDFGANYFYQRGWAAFEAESYSDAQREFARARWLGGGSTTAGDAAFFLAASRLRADDAAAALAGYEEVIAEFPDSIWVAESHYHVGLCLLRLGRVGEAEARFEFVIATYPGNRWALFAGEQLENLRRERQPRSSDG